MSIYYNNILNNKYNIDFYENLSIIDNNKLNDDKLNDDKLNDDKLNDQNNIYGDIIFPEKILKN